MKHLILFFLFFLIGGVQTIGQELIDSVTLRVTYSANYKTEQEQKIKDDVQVLEIGNKSSKYYSRYDYIYRHINDSLEKEGLDVAERSIRMRKEGSTSGDNYQVFKNYPEKGELTYTYIIFNFLYIYEEDMPAMKWDLVEGDTIIGEYACKKAVCELRGRKWTAWYSIDLPYDDGPWKLCGLPGLILDAAESEGIFSFKFAGIERCNDPMTFANKKKYERCTPKQLQDEFREYCKTGSVWAIRKATGLTVPKGKVEGTFTPCQMEFYE